MRPSLLALAWLVAWVTVAPPARAAESVRRQTELEPFSMLDGAALGGGRLGFAFGAGFPYVQGMVAYNAAARVDVDLQLDAFYGASTRLGVGPKVQLASAGGLSLAVRALAQGALFRSSEAAEIKGARYLTGMRNLGVQPALILSARGRHGSVFAELGYEGTFDLEPQSLGPLSGNPGAWTYGSNLLFHLGGELNPGGLVHGYALLGIDFHLRTNDLPALPVVELGLTFPG